VRIVDLNREVHFVLRCMHIEAAGEDDDMCICSLISSGNNSRQLRSKGRYYCTRITSKRLIMRYNYLWGNFTDTHVTISTGAALSCSYLHMVHSRPRTNFCYTIAVFTHPVGRSATKIISIGRPICISRTRLREKVTLSNVFT